MKNETSRGWIFTINNYTEGQVKRGLLWLELDECIGISAGMEVGKGGTPHIQGYVRLGKSTKKTHFQKAIGPGKCGSSNFYMKKANADWMKNAQYTSKDDKVVWFKIPPPKHQGSRTDIVDFREAIKRGADDMELFENHLETLAKFPRLEGRLRQAYQKVDTRAFRKVKVHVRWGDAGCNKTRGPYEGMGPFAEPAWKWNNYEDGWFDGYEGEKTILIDDFYGGIKYTKFLTMLDGYQELLKVKGSFVYANWTTIYITSNDHPRDWYQKGLTPALARRITSIRHFVKGGPAEGVLE